MYESGLAVAFILWFIGNINLLISINSRFEKNLNKIGQRLSWLTLMPVPMKMADVKMTNVLKIFTFSLIALIGFFLILLSWMFVALYVGSFVYKKMKDIGAPKTVKEFRWKLRNTDMTFDQIVKEVMKVTDQDPVCFESFRNDLINDLESKGLLAVQR